MDEMSRRLIIKKAREMIGNYKYDAKGVRDANGNPKMGDEVMDCSEFVYAVYVATLGIPGFTYLNSPGIAASPKFEKIETPLAGDIVYWPGPPAHVDCGKS